MNDVNLLCPQHFGAELGWLLSSCEAGSVKPRVLSILGKKRSERIVFYSLLIQTSLYTGPEHLLCVILDNTIYSQVLFLR